MAASLRTLVERVPARLTAHLIDVSGEALNRATQTLGGPRTHRDRCTHRVVRRRIEHDRRAARGRTRARAVLGSNIGNFDRPTSEQLLRRIHGRSVQEALCWSVRIS
jgi:hypothetical protein